MTAITKDLRARFGCETNFGRTSRQYHVSEQEISGLLATETYHPPGFKIPKHAHELASFYLILDGSLTETLPRTTCDRGRHSVVFTAPGEMHSNEFHDKGGRCFLVELTSTWSDRLKHSGLKLETTFEATNTQVTRLASSLYKEFQSVDKVSPLCVEGLGLEILAAFSRNSENGNEIALPQWLHATRDLLHDRFAEMLTLDEIAGHVEIHPVHLARTFRKRFGCTVGEYQRRLRVDHAARQLAGTRASLSEIALEAGFADQSHFSRVFKAHTGFSPARFRSHLNS